LRSKDTGIASLNATHTTNGQKYYYRNCVTVVIGLNKTLNTFIKPFYNKPARTYTKSYEGLYICASSSSEFKLFTIFFRRFYLIVEKDPHVSAYLKWCCKGCPFTHLYISIKMHNLLKPKYNLCLHKQRRGNF